MKICAMCGRKILKQSMLHMKIMDAKAKMVDACGNCYMLTKVNDNILLLLKEVKNGRLEQSRA